MTNPSSPCSVPGWLRGIIPFETPDQQAVCQAHDECYSAGGTRIDRLWADLQFCQGLLVAGMSADMAEKYLWGVRLYGGSHWKDKDSPGCLPPPPPIQLQETQAP